MQYHRIPHSSLEVSTLGLGTMTFGEQNSEADAHAQLDYAVAQGINLIDVSRNVPSTSAPRNARVNRNLRRQLAGETWQPRKVNYRLQSERTVAQ